MARPVSVLVVASVTADSAELVEALKERQETRGEVRFTLVLPCTGPGLGTRAAAQERVDAVLAKWGEAGLRDVQGMVGDQQPTVAVLEVWDPLQYDEIVVSTLPGQTSEWQRANVPHRIGRATDAQVTHVVSSPPAPAPASGPVQRAEKSPLGPLSVLGWGNRPDDAEKDRERRLKALRQH